MIARLIDLILRRPLGILLLAGVPVFLANYFVGNPGISGWDANHYYSYAAAIADGGTLDLARAYDAIVAAGGDPVSFDSSRRTTTGQVYNFYPLGHPILHAPAAWVGSVVAILTEGHRHAFGWTAQLFYCLSCIAAAAAGIAFTRRALDGWVSPQALSVSLYTLAACSMLGYYWFVLPALSHTTTLLSTGATMLVLRRLAEQPMRGPAVYALLGALVGWAVTVRLHDIGAGFLALAGCVIAWRAASLSRPQAIARIAAIVIAGAGVFALQMLHWRWKDGVWLPRSYSDYAYFDFSVSNHLGVLFSPRHGLFLWHPILLAAFCGFLLWWRAQFRPAPTRTMIAVGLLCFFASILLVGGFFSIWWFGDSFGSRPFLSVLPLFWLGLAWTWDVAAQRGRQGMWLASAAVLALANGVLAISFHLGWISRSGALF